MTGTQALYYNKKVTILRVTDKEVLLLQAGKTKWVDKGMFNLVSNIRL
jgi:hypothetical protein